MVGTRTDTPVDRARVAEAIRAAEATTSGEIYCVLARSSSTYFHEAAATLAVGLLIASIAAAAVLHWLWLSMSPLHFALAQLVAYGAGLAVLWLAPSLRIALVPRRVRYRQAHANAMRQFLARNVHLTEARTGVLVFVSLAERYGEIVADGGIDAKVPQERWNATVAALTTAASRGDVTEGFAVAVAAVGAELAQHFPRRPDDRNELDDHLVEI